MSSSSSSRTAINVLIAVAAGHLINDLLQSLLPAIYPILKDDFHLDFWQVGMITLANQMTASLLQPVVGHALDRHPRPHALAFGMSITLGGLVLLAAGHRFALVVLAAALIGVGSSIFHPESSRVARAASGGRHGVAQSLFQTGGNFGSSLGPLLAAFVVAPYGRHSIGWFTIIAAIGVATLWRIGEWHTRARAIERAESVREKTTHPPMPAAHVRRSLVILVALVFSKFIYMASLSNYYTFFLIHRFGLSIQQAQLYLFGFLAAVAAGTFAGGPLGDRIGRKAVIWVSIGGVLPFSLLLPYASLFWTGVLSVIIGLVLSSAFSAILVYAQELLPGRVGLIAGLFFGLAFGIGGLGAAALGKLADVTSLDFVYRLCSLLPAIGLLTAFLPDLPGSMPVRAKPATAGAR
ncbi:MAG TPA: MFS transporter [Vicinamibacterales bacterium]|nr:MFS transporter [Vicinamibacterales bacterium]